MLCTAHTHYRGFANIILISEFIYMYIYIYLDIVSEGCKPVRLHDDRGTLPDFPDRALIGY